MELFFWDKLQLLFSNPKEFFDRFKDEGITQAIITYAIIIVSVVTVKSLFLIGAHMLFDDYGLGSLYMGVGSSFTAVTSLLYSFVMAGLIHIMVIIFKGTHDFATSYKIFAYSLIPYWIISIIPLIGGVSFIYSVILMIIGVSQLHEISIGKSIAVVLIPFLVFTVSIIAFAIIVISKFIVSQTII